MNTAHKSKYTSDPAPVSREVLWALWKAPRCKGELIHDAERKKWKQ